MSKYCVKNDAENSKCGKKSAKTRAKTEEAVQEERMAALEAALETPIDDRGNTVRDVSYSACNGQVGIARFMSGALFRDKFAMDNSGSKPVILAWHGSLWKKDECETYLDAVHSMLEICRKALDILPVPVSEEDPVNMYRTPIIAAMKSLKQCAASRAICLRALSGEDGCIVPADAWNKDIGLLNTPGGIVDLATGELREAKPSDYLRRQTAVEYIPQDELPAPPTLWLQTLSDVFMPLGMPEEPQYEDTKELMMAITAEEDQLDSADFTFGDSDYAMLCDACKKYEDAVAANAEKKRAYEEAMKAWKNGNVIDQIIEFFQRFCGYTLLGTNPEQKFAILIGHKGRNGKGVIAHTLRNILGDYAAETRSELFLKTRSASSGSATPELMKLDGKRLVVGSETDRGDKMNAAFIKRVSGADKMSGRGLYKEETEFLPSFVIWMLTNFFPHFDSEDNAFLKRCIVIPFNRTFVYDPQEITPLVGRRDDKLEDKLMEEKEAILAWCIEGARKYLVDGLKISAVIEEAAETYRQNKDVIGCFLEECCDVEPGLETPSSILYGAYAQWSHDGQMKPSNRSMFKDRMTARGFQYVKNSSFFVRGVALNSIGDEMFAAYEYRNGHKRS